MTLEAFYLLTRYTRRQCLLVTVVSAARLHAVLCRRPAGRRHGVGGAASAVCAAGPGGA